MKDWSNVPKGTIKFEQATCERTSSTYSTEEKNDKLKALSSCRSRQFSTSVSDILAKFQNG